MPAGAFPEAMAPVLRFDAAGGCGEAFTCLYPFPDRQISADFVLG